MCNRLTTSSKGLSEPAFGNVMSNLPSTPNSVLAVYYINSAENAIIDSFHARRRLIERLFDAGILHNKHEKLFDITAN